MFWLQDKRDAPDRVIAGRFLPEQFAAHCLLPASPKLLLEMTDAERMEAHLTNPTGNLKHAAK